MSFITPGQGAAFNLVGSFAGAQRNDAKANAQKAAGAEQNFQIDQQLLTARNVDGVTESNLTSDRDPDGRRLDEELQQQPDDEQTTDDEDETSKTSHRSSDAHGIRGNALDLEV